MESLGFARLEDLQHFLNLPVLSSLRMQPPDYEEIEQVESRWQEYQQA
jgi:hypothetical protein